MRIFIVSEKLRKDTTRDQDFEFGELFEGSIVTFLSCRVHLLLSHKKFSEKFLEYHNFHINKQFREIFFLTSAKISCHKNILTKNIPVFHMMLTKFCLFCKQLNESSTSDNFISIFAVAPFNRYLFYLVYQNGVSSY